MGLTAAFLMIIIATSCKKDNNSGGGPVSATINGTAWSGQSLFSDAEHTSGYVTIYSAALKSGDTSGFTIQVHDSTKVGETDEFLLSAIGYTIATSTGQSFYSSSAYYSHGSLTLTTRDQTGHKIAGTFSGVLYKFSNSSDSIKIENGHFNMTYTED